MCGPNSTCCNLMQTAYETAYKVDNDPLRGVPNGAAREVPTLLPLARCSGLTGGLLLLATCLAQPMAVAAEDVAEADLGYQPSKNYEPMDALKGKDYGKQRYRWG